MTTIHDVAKLAGVSPGTVSNAFNWPEKVKPATYERIVAAAKTLNYQPNVMAKGLSSGKTFSVGLLTSDIRVPIVANITRGIEDKLDEAGYVPIISSTDGDSDKTLRLIDQLRRHGACGYIVVPAQFGVTPAIIDKLEQLHAEGFPTIVSGHDVLTDRISSVSIGGKQTAVSLTQHLIDLGHRDIAYITPYFSQGQGVLRWYGFQAAMAASGMPIRDELVKEIEVTPADSYAAMEELMALEKPPTAVFAMNDILARGVIDYITRHQIKVPNELSIVGYDYKALAQRTTPRITSMVVPAYDLGWKTAELFINIQRNPNSPAQMIQLPYTLEVRETTAPPKQTE